MALSILCISHVGCSLTSRFFFSTPIPLKPSGSTCVTCFDIQTLCAFRKQSICWFLMILGVDSDYFLKHH